jgi:hypothetical protein
VREGREVGHDGLGRPVGEEQPDGAREVAGELVDAVGLGVFGGGAQGAGSEFGFAEEDAGWEGVGWLVWGFLVSWEGGWLVG